MKQLYEFLINNKSTGVIKNAIEFVDLGLESGTLWGKCNLGAEEETDAGNYYMFGYAEKIDNTNIKPKTQFKKYTKEDSIVELCPEDDAVTKIANNKKCKIPKFEDFSELFKSTNYTYVENYSNNINGILLSSNVNKNNLFIPQSGYYYNGKFFETTSDCLDILLMTRMMDVYTVNNNINDACIQVFSMNTTNRIITKSIMSRTCLFQIRPIKIA